MVVMKVILGSDHRGFKLKERVKDFLKRKKIDFLDVGTHEKKSVDYPDFAQDVAKKVAKNKKHLGILICGTGTGMVIAANKIKGARAAVAYDNYSAKMAREDNNANILALRGRFYSWDKVRRIISIWLNTPFSKKTRHKKRLEKRKFS